MLLLLISSGPAHSPSLHYQVRDVRLIMDHNSRSSKGVGTIRGLPQFTQHCRREEEDGGAVADEEDRGMKRVKKFKRPQSNRKIYVKDFDIVFQDGSALLTKN